MTWFYVIAGMVVGMAIGSFLNVVIYRVPRGRSLVRPASACPACDTPLGWRDNAPVISFLLLKGRCRYCGVRISRRYPLVELATGALFAGSVGRFGVSEAAVFVALTGSILIAVAAIDLEFRRIPNVIVLPATAGCITWIVAVAAARSEWSVVSSALASGATGFLLLFVLAVSTGGIGFGDVKLTGLIGLAAGRFGWETFVLALFGSFILGGLVAAALLASGRRGRKDALPFGPYLSAGAIGALFAGAAPVRGWLGL